METKKPTKVKLASLWSKQLPSGVTVISGYLGDAQVEIWPNGFKKEDKHPSHILYVVEKFKKEEPKVQSTQEPHADPFFRDEIPF